MYSGIGPTAGCRWNLNRPGPRSAQDTDKVESGRIALLPDVNALAVSLARGRQLAFSAACYRLPTQCLPPPDPTGETTVSPVSVSLEQDAEYRRLRAAFLDELAAALTNRDWPTLATSFASTQGYCRQCRFLVVDYKGADQRNQARGHRLSGGCGRACRGGYRESRSAV
jgi:hypothetical protein